MPIYEPDHVEYSIAQGHIQIVLDSGDKLPAYWAHPKLGDKFPAIAIIHDWWGLDDEVRRIANLFAQTGYYVIAPDLFDGRTTNDPQQAIELVKRLKDGGYPRIHQALGVLEHHHHVNKHVAAVGIGMGGSLAFEAAIVRGDLEAAVVYGGFPQRYFGRFKEANTPIYAFYGEHEPHISPADIKKLLLELEAASKAKGIANKLKIVPGLGHEFFSKDFNEERRRMSRLVLKETFDFLDDFLEGMQRSL
jgi:carboxymethylenebutenolidase